MVAYRPNVAFILKREPGEILICERSDWPGCWQFPQGGKKASETTLEALHREVLEELSLLPEDYKIIENKGPYRYLFSDGRTKNGFHGQEQTYFLANLLALESKLRFEGDSPEFQAYRWIHPVDYDLSWVAPMKREVYRQVFRDFFGIERVLEGIV